MELEEKSQPQTGKTFFSMGLFILMPAVAFYLMEAYEHNAFVEVRSFAAFFNILLFELLAATLYFLTGKMHIAVRIEYFLAMLFGLVNHYVMAFRSTPFVPWDLFSLKTAKSVAGNYDFTPSGRVVVVTILFLGLLFFAGILKKGPAPAWQIRLCIAAIVIGVLGFFVHCLQQENFQKQYGLYPFLFTPAYMTKVNGMAVTFAMDLAFVAVEKPKGYDEKEAERTLEKYKGKENEADTEELPNIIVVMNESFSDPAVLGPLSTNEDYMPFMHEMQKGKENTITGYAQVSVCGGNTANSEFEFLTGNTMAFLPAGSIPYQQYIKKETPSLASYLESLGYETYAQHPYMAQGWDRERVYPLLGFSHMDFLDSYIRRSYVRKYISDRSDAEHIIDTYENKEKGKPLFLFNVTMQNHGGYTEEYADFTEEIHSQYGDLQLDQYLSLVRLSDDALKELVSYFQEEDEKTMILFFGDHQPADSVVAPIVNASAAKTSGEENSRYLVPYLVWANFEIEGAKEKNTSLNYLAAQALSAAGVPLDAYRNYLLGLSEGFPVLSAAGKTALPGAHEGALLTYQKLQYYELFEGDRK